MNTALLASSLRVLVVDDEPDMAATLNQLLQQDGCSVDTAGCAQEALSLLETQGFDLVLSDLSMPGMDGVELLREVKARNAAAEMVIITGYGTINSAVDAMRCGAANYLIKPVEPEEILAVADRVRNRLQVEPVDGVSASDGCRFHKLIGRSPRMRKIFSLIPKVSRMHGSVLIQGESGSGKELVAEAIHVSSPRAKKRFVPIDCGALTETLLESELFGHKQGSFTGSTSDRVGMIESAHGGTLLLDEIGNSTEHLQSRLLRVIEEKKVRRIGENSSIPVDVRILAASNIDLSEMVEKGLFREDLYYRLCGFVIEIPPLRERKEDIPLLVQHFIEINASLYEKVPTAFSAEAMETLMQYQWPGNVRELRVVVDRAVAMADGPVIEKKDLIFSRSFRASAPSAGLSAPASMIETPFYDAVETYERRYLVELLERTNGNISQASQMSGASRKTIREKGRKFGLL
ncbi:sigma-54 dependent transcriptional regulator [bacterium]|nr:sigma-54 dependent transcriptional regulator [bacterium]